MNPSTKFFFFMAALLAATLCPAPANAQRLRGQWVNEANDRIEKHRMTDLHVIVLDREGKPVPHVEVHIDMQEHDFAFGVVLDAEEFKDVANPPHFPRQEQVWRCFNAVAIDKAAQWPDLQPIANAWDFTRVDDMLYWAAVNNYRVRWGGVVSANPDKMPPWLTQQDDATLRKYLDTHVQRVMNDYGNRVTEFDLMTDTLDHNFVRARLGAQMERQLHELGEAMAPRTQIGVRFTDALIGPRLRDAMKVVADRQEQFIPTDIIVFDEMITGNMVQVRLARAMDWLNEMRTPIVIGSLEVGGTSYTGAALNMEMILRTLFAEPKVEGIYLSGVLPEHVRTPYAALIDENGDVTEPGKVYEGLVHELWWTNDQVKADELGSVYHRVFAGRYHVSAVLPDGTIAQTTVRLPVAGTPRVVMIQPMAAPESKPAFSVEDIFNGNGPSPGSDKSQSAAVDEMEQR